jgi:mannitol/fructose-specific phosphotransferase system IIA component (Ntr-type)
MRLSEFFTPDAVQLDLRAASRDDVIERLVAALHVDERAQATLLKVLARREQLGTTGMGRGIAIPHCRSLVVPRVRMAYARVATPLEWDALDGKPVRHVFLIAAPPVEVANQYLPALGHLAQFAKDAEALAALERVATPAEFTQLLDSRGI